LAETRRPGCGLPPISVPISNCSWNTVPRTINTSRSKRIIGIYWPGRRVDESGANFQEAGRIEAVVSGKEDPAGNGWVTHSRWRVVGDAEFTDQPLGGAGSVPSSAFVGFEIPAGQKLYLRNVRVKTDSAASLWLLVFPAAALVVMLIVVVSAWAIMKKRRAPTQVNVQPDKATS
jgi:hypothetical protein